MIFRTIGQAPGDGICGSKRRELGTAIGIAGLEPIEAMKLGERANSANNVPHVLT